MNLRSESKTLFIPLFGKALMSKNNLFLKDSKAEEIIDSVDYDFSSLKQSKWLSMYMSVRALIIDEICNQYIDDDTIVIHLGCGLDSRVLRVKQTFKKWYDIDYENVIELRKKYYTQNNNYQMIGSSVTDYKWLKEIDSSKNILVILEGVTMYLKEEEIKELIYQLEKKFTDVHLLFDAYSKMGVNLSKIKNPAKQMGADIKYGIGKPKDFLKLNDNLVFIQSYIIKQDDNSLSGFTKFIFNKLFCGKISQSLYKIYEFKLSKNNKKV